MGSLKRLSNAGARILANRQSAQRSRVRKLQYISELERSVTTLQVYRIITSKFNLCQFLTLQFRLDEMSSS